MSTEQIYWNTGDMIETPGNVGTRLYVVDSILLGAMNQESILELTAIDQSPPADVAGRSNAPIHVPMEMLEAGIRAGIFTHTKHDDE
jgi:hypothetical protein